MRRKFGFLLIFQFVVLGSSCVKVEDFQEKFILKTLLCEDERLLCYDAIDSSAKKILWNEPFDTESNFLLDSLMNIKYGIKIMVQSGYVMLEKHSGYDLFMIPFELKEKDNVEVEITLFLDSDIINYEKIFVMGSGEAKYELFSRKYSVWKEGEEPRECVDLACRIKNKKKLFSWN